MLPGALPDNSRAADENAAYRILPATASFVALPAFTSGRTAPAAAASADAFESIPASLDDHAACGALDVLGWPAIGQVDFVIRVHRLGVGCRTHRRGHKVQSDALSKSAREETHRPAQSRGACVRTRCGIVARGLLSPGAKGEHRSSSAS
jgi:hypothetical protein